MSAKPVHPSSASPGDTCKSSALADDGWDKSYERTETGDTVPVYRDPNSNLIGIFNGTDNKGRNIYIIDDEPFATRGNPW